MRQIRKAQGMHLEDGLHPNNFKRLADISEELEYTDPVAAATDETVCVKAMRHYNGYLVGAQGGDIPFSDGDQIERLVKSTVTKNQLCSKVGPSPSFIPFELSLPTNLHTHISFSLDSSLHHSDSLIKYVNICSRHNSQSQPG